MQSHIQRDVDGLHITITIDDDALPRGIAESDDTRHTKHAAALAAAVQAIRDTYHTRQ